MMLPKTYASPIPARIGLLCMLVLLAFAGYFYLERAAFLDLALHVFAFLKDKRLFVQNQRSVAIITQIWPLLAAKAGLPIDPILRLYSLVFVGYYLAVYVVVAYVFRNQQVALAVPLLFTLLVSYTFYWAQSELPQSLALLLLYYGGVSRLSPLRPDWRTAGLFLLIPVCVYGHPLMILPFGFLWGYDYLLNRRFRDGLYYASLAVALVSYWFRTHNIIPGSYEAQRMHLWESAVVYFPRYWALDGNQDLLWMCWNRMYLLPVLLVALLAFVAAKRPAGGWVRLAWIWGFTLFYTQIVVVSYPNHSDRIYLENLYMPLGLFVAVPFAMEVLPALRSGRLVGGLLAAVFAFRLAVIYQTHVPYTAYQQWLERVLAYVKQYPERKYLLDQANADPYLQRAGSWASPFETMLLSARVSPDSVQSLLVTDRVAEFRPRLGTTDRILMPWDEVEYSWLPANYFRPPHTAYRLLNTPPPADTAALSAYIKARLKTKLEVLGFAKKLRVDKVRPLALRLSSPPGLTLHSGLGVSHPTVLTYRFLSADGWPVESEILTTPLEIDVDGTWAQHVVVVCPPAPGAYLLEVSLTSRGFRQWPTRVRFPVEVGN